MEFDLQFEAEPSIIAGLSCDNCNVSSLLLLLNIKANSKLCLLINYMRGGVLTAT